MGLGKNENSEEANLVYGVQSIKMDSYLLKVKKYSAFNTEVVTGKSPVNDYFRDFGILIPQGEARTARTENGDRIKHVQVMYMEPPKGGSIANGIRVWNHGGGSTNPSNGKMEDKIEMLTYRGIRGSGLNQFIIVEAA
jgi:hypothetical protein